MERDLAGLRIGELASRTGIGVPTLRAWESRYRLFHPSRTEGGQRLYSAADEERVREVQRLVAEGVSVGAAARWVAAHKREDLAGSSSHVDGDGVAGRGNPPDHFESLALVHDATRAIVHAVSPADVVAVLADFVRRTGASLVDAPIDDTVLPIDISHGEGPCLLPRAEPMSPARLTLEHALPGLVEDAGRLIDLLRRAAPRDSFADSGYR